MKRWLFIGALVMSGCGSPANPCGRCPEGTECRLTTYIPSIGGSRYECVAVVMVIDVPLTQSCDGGGGPSAPASDE